MKNKLKFLLPTLLLSTLLAIALWPNAQAQLNTYGPPPVVDTWGNTLLGSFLRTSNTMVSNTIIDPGPATSLNVGTNNLYISTNGVANDYNVVRIGGSQTNIYFSGTITSSPLSTNVVTIAQGSTGYTNNTASDGFAYIYATNGAISFYAGNVGTNTIQVTGIPATSGILTFFMLPGWSLVGTNISGHFVAGP